MGYSDDDAMVRVDFFKTDEHGRPYKWYTDEAVKWLTWKGDPREGGKLIHDAFLEALSASGSSYRGMLAVCLEPYHEHAYPIVLTVP